MDKWPVMSLLLEGVVYTHFESGLLWPIFVGKLAYFGFKNLASLEHAALV